MIATTVDESGTRRAVTKLVEGERLVSCTCCTEGCCPYPAEQLGIGYLEEDLPDTITFDPNFSADIGAALQTATRSGEIYTTPTYTYTILGNTFTKTSSVGRGLEGDPGVDVWGVLQDGLDPSNPNRCLFRVGDSDSLDSVEWRDDYLDTYTVNTYDDFVGGSPVSSFVITRTALCLWTGFDDRYGSGTTVSLHYNTPTSSSTRSSMWTMQGFGRVDGGPFKSPQGTYLDGNYVWEVV
jgi:hypothetical protein